MNDSDLEHSQEEEEENKCIICKCGEILDKSNNYLSDFFTNNNFIYLYKKNPIILADYLEVLNSKNLQKFNNQQYNKNNDDQYNENMNNNNNINNNKKLTNIYNKTYFNNIFDMDNLDELIQICECKEKFAHKKCLIQKIIFTLEDKCEECHQKYYIQIDDYIKDDKRKIVSIKSTIILFILMIIFLVLSIIFLTCDVIHNELFLLLNHIIGVTFLIIWVFIICIIVKTNLYIIHMKNPLERFFNIYMNKDIYELTEAKYNYNLYKKLVIDKNKEIDKYFSENNKSLGFKDDYISNCNSINSNFNIFINFEDINNFQDTKRRFTINNYPKIQKIEISNFKCSSISSSNSNSPNLINRKKINHININSQNRNAYYKSSFFQRYNSANTEDKRQIKNNENNICPKNYHEKNKILDVSNNPIPEKNECFEDFSPQSKLVPKKDEIIKLCKLEQNNEENKSLSIPKKNINNLESKKVIQISKTMQGNDKFN